jgi:hypothetical protein
MRNPLLRELFGGRRRHRYGRPYGLARRRPQRRRGFGFFGPFPTYSTRTRRGTHVSVGGCCLPLALALAAAPVAALRILLRG